MSILSDEITNDISVRGYIGMSNAEVANSLMNTIDREINKTSMTGREIFAQQNDIDYAALSDAKKQAWLSLTSQDDIDPYGPAVQTVIDIWGVGSITISNLNAARTTTVSRAQELGLGSVNEGDVLQARV